MHRLLLMLTILASTNACYWGPKPNTFAPALGPQGVEVAVRVSGVAAETLGELYAVDSTGIILRAGKLQRIPWSRVIAMDAENLDEEFDIVRRGRPDAAKVARLRLVSRFPQGLHGEMLRAVLKQLGQADLREP